jgi:hydrogenase maturation protein HypF
MPHNEYTLSAKCVPSSSANGKAVDMQARILVKGIVQGVGFRPFIYRLATRLELAGFVRNRADAVVEILLQGPKERLDAFLEALNNERPPMARIQDVSVEFMHSDEVGLNGFQIVASGQERRETGSTIPADIAICSNCLSELRKPTDRRFDYFFITCTDCGPRFSAIERLPYDRPNTSMVDFPMCKDCEAEYRNPSDRRFHAQTVACPKCGPKALLVKSDGTSVDTDDPIREAGRLISAGRIVAIKGVGGFHLAASTLLPDPLRRLRSSKKRRQKPFAVMARDLAAVTTFARVNRVEEELLTSYHCPIVLLEKSDNYTLSEQIAPNLHNVGVMLPYTGLHVILFDSTQERAFVMTSGNAPNEPIVSENEEALKKLGDVADYFLLHDRRIVNRSDDSVARVVEDSAAVIRRSRGYAPTPILLGSKASKCAIGTGAELNASPCLVVGQRAYFTQHIGDLETDVTVKFHMEALANLRRLVGGTIEAVGCDLHPNFNSTRIGESLAEENGIRAIKVQHHHAHVRALMAEHGLDEIVGVCCDGFGYGADGTAWGGEILVCRGSKYQRAGHLETQPMVGGDLATTYPLRMVAGIQRDDAATAEWLMSRQYLFRHGKTEIETIFKQLKKRDFTLTSSCGRVLDAAAALLGICYERTYEGEPAMKLESAAIGGRYTLGIEPVIQGNVLLTTPLIHELFGKLNENSIRDMAFSAEEYLARGLAELATAEAQREGIRSIGFSGGVAYNAHIVSTAARIARSQGFGFLLHKEAPPGDEGIALGQALVAADLTD